MSNVYDVKGVSSVSADIESADSGGFTAIASNGDLDRDNERLQPGCFSPLPKSIPVHLDHEMSAEGVIARARPYYVGNDLMVDATFDAGSKAQEIRRKVNDRILDSMSIVFRGLTWKDIDGVRTCVDAELLAADIVSIPSNSGARILSMRSMRPSVREAVREVTADALLFLAREEIAELKRAGYGPTGPKRRKVDAAIHDMCNPNADLFPNYRRRSL